MGRHAISSQLGHGGWEPSIALGCTEVARRNLQRAARHLSDAQLKRRTSPQEMEVASKKKCCHCGAVTKNQMLSLEGTTFYTFYTFVRWTALHLSRGIQLLIRHRCEVELALLDMGPAPNRDAVRLPNRLLADHHKA